MGTESPTLFLIAHKVRGELAFDTAHRLQIGDEQGWIIPTSGHRAYPYWSMELSIPDLGPMPDDLPDHYQVTAAQERKIEKAAEKVPSAKDIEQGMSLLAALGLSAVKDKVTRR